MHVVVLAEVAVASGGAEKVALESARGLAEAGVDVTYLQAVSGEADPLLDHPRLQRICLGLEDVWNLPAVRAAVAGIWSAEAARRLVAALAALPRPPDILHLHQWTRALSPSVLPVLLNAQAPLVLTLHDYFLVCPTGVYYRFDRSEPCTLRPLSAGCLASACDPRSRLHKLVRLGRTAALRMALGRAPLDVIHVCDASVGRIGSLLAGRTLRHHRVDNPVRVEKAVPAEPARGDAIVYVGRLTREKGADLVAAAAREAGIPALFIGAGPLEAELAAQGAELVGWRSPQEVEAILVRRARAVCASSRWYETGPLTIYEAMARGIPVVASRRSGSAEKVEDGRTGFVAEPEVGALAAVFRQCIDDGRVGTMGRAAYDAYWSAPMTMSRHADALLALYRKIAAAADTKQQSFRAGSEPANELIRAGEAAGHL